MMTDQTRESRRGARRSRGATPASGLVRLLAALLLAAGVIGLGGLPAFATPAAAQTEDDEETPEAGEKEESQPKIGREDSDSDVETYESPQYGYRIEYDPAVWSIQGEDENPDDAYDQIFLTNEVSVIGLFGDPDYAPDELDQCIADYVAGMEDNESNTEVEPLADPDAEGEEDDRIWATYTYIYTFEDGEEAPYTRYFECMALDDTLTLVVVQDVLSDDYAGEIEAREELLGGFDAGAGPAEEPEEAEESPTAEEPVAEESGVYESPLYGYRIEYDPAVWSVVGGDDDPDDVYDRISLTNEVSTLSLFGDPDYASDELDQCLADYTAGLEQNENISEIEPLAEPDAEGAEEVRSWATYTYLFTAQDGEEAPFTRYIECVALDDDLAFVIVQTVPAEEYANEIEAREDLLGGFELGDRPVEDVDDTEESPTADESALADAVEIFEITDTSHTEVGTAQYDQNPPAGGAHHDFAQDCGFYDEPLINEHAVHSLEHGAVWITYDPDLPADEIALLEEMALDEERLLVSPFLDLPSPVVASAWGVQLQLETAADPLLAQFIATYVNGEFAPEPGAPCAGTDVTAG